MLMGANTIGRAESIIGCFNSLMDSDLGPVLLLDGNGKVYALNRAAREAFELQCGNSLAEIATGPEQLKTYLHKCAGTSEPLPGALRTAVKGAIVEWRADGGALKLDDGDGDGFVLLRLRPSSEAHRFFNTLNEKVQALNSALRLKEEFQIELQRVIGTKDILLSEVQHRIKNNLQIVLSLLSLSARSAPDALSKACLLDAAQRINAMGLVHTLLYSAPSFDVVDSGRLIGLLIDAAKNAYGRDGIEIEVDLAPLLICHEDAFPLAMIANELVVNALKHAFANGSGGVIRIDWKANGAGLVISVKDDGVPFQSVKAGTGFTLVKALASKLGGEVQIANSPIKCVSVWFPSQMNKAERHIQ